MARNWKYYFKQGPCFRRCS